MSDDRPMPAWEVAAAVGSGRLSAEAPLAGCLERIERFDETLQCFREVNRAEATHRVHELNGSRTSDPPRNRLLGVPIAIKDNICSSVGTTSAGSRMLAGYRSPYTATAVQRLESEGAVIIGKTNCDEFAMGSSTEHCAYGKTRNPWNTDRVPGGSSGGSAAAVAAGLCAAALGSDTGGSIRQPAAFCGIVGLKPTYGRVSRSGLIAYGSSLDQVGPMTRSVRDAALLLHVLAGADERDSTTGDVGIPDYLADLDEPIAALRIGVVKQHLTSDNHPAINQRMEEAIEVYRHRGAQIVEVDLSLTRYSVASYYIIATAEASSNLARYDGVRYGHRAALHADASLADLYAASRSEGFGAEVQRRIILGTYVLSAGYCDAYYRRAMQVRRLIRQQLDEAFQQCDVLLGPTAPTPAFRFSEKADAVAMYLSDIYTTTANLAGICAISIPCGFASDNGTALPVGLQLQAAPFDEVTLLRAAQMFESATDYHLRSPNLTALTTPSSGPRASSRIGRA